MSDFETLKEQDRPSSSNITLLLYAILSISLNMEALPNYIPEAVSGMAC
jgi:hypothetical protein